MTRRSLSTRQKKTLSPVSGTAPFSFNGEVIVEESPYLIAGLLHPGGEHCRVGVQRGTDILMAQNLLCYLDIHVCFYQDGRAKVPEVVESAMG